jgi:hypothetical protein
MAGSALSREFLQAAASDALVMSMPGRHLARRRDPCGSPYGQAPVRRENFSPQIAVAPLISARFARH